MKDELEQVFTRNNVGVYDRHEVSIDYNDGILYMYGANAEALFKTIMATLLTKDFYKGAKAKLRF